MRKLWIVAVGLALAGPAAAQNLNDVGKLLQDQLSPGQRQPDAAQQQREREIYEQGRRDQDQSRRNDNRRRQDADRDQDRSRDNRRMGDDRRRSDDRQRSERDQDRLRSDQDRAYDDDRRARGQPPRY